MRVHSVRKNQLPLLMFYGLFRVEGHSACGINQQISMMVAPDGTGKLYANSGQLERGNCTHVHLLNRLHTLLWKRTLYAMFFV